MSARNATRAQGAPLVKFTVVVHSLVARLVAIPGFPGTLVAVAELLAWKRCARCARLTVVGVGRVARRTLPVPLEEVVRKRLLYA